MSRFIGLAVQLTLPFCMGVLLVVFPIEGRADESQPTQLRVMLQEAEEAFFDGEYEHAKRLADESLMWLRVPRNQELLWQRSQQDYTFLMGLVHLLIAQIEEHSGDLRAAMRKTDQAEKILHDRRIVNNVQNQDVQLLWLAEAYLNLLRGDLVQASPLFLSELSELDIPRDLLQRFEGGDEKLQSVVKQLQNHRPASRYYDRAEEILEKHVFALNPPRQPLINQDNTKWLDRAERLYRRVLVANARQRLMNHDNPLSDRIRDAESFVVRAENRLESTFWWKTFVVAPGGLPKTYIEYEQSIGRGDFGFNGGFATYDGGNSLAEVAAGGGWNLQRLNQKQLLDTKREWAHKYGDWLEVALTRAELQALRLGREEQGGGDVTMPDAIYQQARGMLSTQFSHKHPLVLKVLLSRLRWSMSRLVFRAEQVTAQNARGFLSECRDCLYQTALLRAWDVNASDRRLAEFDVIEIRTLAIIWSVTELQSLLSRGDRLEILGRVEQISSHINELAF